MRSSSMRALPLLGSLLAASLMLGPVMATRSPAVAAEAGTGTDQEADFMRRTGAEPGVRTLPSGLEYKILQSGDPAGKPPAVGDQLVLNYDGKLPDGATFDSTERQGGMARMTFDGLVPGWMEGLKLMRPGDVWMLYLPSRLGYGDRGQGPIPPNSPLVFKIELIAVHPASG